MNADASDSPPLSVDHVRAVLQPHGLTVQEVPSDTSTAVLAARALNTTVPAIVKSLVFIADGTPVLVLVPGNRKVTRESLARHLGAGKVRLARPEEALEHAGYAVGGVPPVGHRRPLRTIMDPGLFEHVTVWAAAGGPNAVFAVAAAHLQQITGADILDVTE